MFLVAVVTLSGAGNARQSPDSSAPQGATHNETGTVCVLPNSPEPPTRFSRGGEYNPATLTISIDKQPPVAWPHKRTVKIENLTLSDRHLIVLRSDGKPIQSFRFRFSGYKDTLLCVYYDGYQGVQFGDKYNTFWCKCR
jgi:hypothetical protein